MKHIFRVVVIHTGPGGSVGMVYTVTGKDDVDARRRAVKLFERDTNYEDAPELRYCEIKCQGELDG